MPDMEKRPPVQPKVAEAAPAVEAMKPRRPIAAEPAMAEPSLPVSDEAKKKPLV
jgi:hypothetical protein